MQRVFLKPPQKISMAVFNRASGLSRRQMLTTAGMCGLSLPAFLQLQRMATGQDAAPAGKARSCIILYCWGGMSHLESWDPKPHAPADIRGTFAPIATAIPGIEISEHMPLLARQTGKLAIIRSIHHDDSAHGRGMYWNFTGHKPPRTGNIAPDRNDWPSLAAMISRFRSAPRGVPTAVRLPYPMVDNNTLQAGEYGGWLGVKYDPIVIRTPSGEPFGGVSRALGSEVLDLGDIDRDRAATRGHLLASLEKPICQPADFENFITSAVSRKTFFSARRSERPMTSKKKTREFANPMGSISAGRACCWRDASPRQACRWCRCAAPPAISMAVRATCGTRTAIISTGSRTGCSPFLIGERQPCCKTSPIEERSSGLWSSC
jgi:hypothetical protein